MREPPLWPQFEEFLETQSQACRERERLGLATPGTQTGGAPSHECTRCKSKNHNQSDCRAQFCLQCRAWTCRNNTHKKQRNPPQEREDGDSYCYFCGESHPFGSHTKSRAESRKRDAAAITGQKSHMQTASTCRRCKLEVKDSPQTCGACGQVGKLGDRLHCFDHCLEFIKAEPDERLRQVMKYGDCTICLIRDHSTDTHMARATQRARSRWG